MNLKEFTETVDQEAEKRNKNELLCFIHSIARKVPEVNREDFLEILKNTGSGMKGKENLSAKLIMRKSDEKEIQRESERLEKLFDKITEEELFLHADGYEDYSNGYWEDNWIWEYEDPNNICQVYEDAAELVKLCVNDGFYQKAVELFDLMEETCVSVKNDWDWFDMGIEELVKEELVSLDLSSLALYVLYAAYQASEPKKRAQEIYEYFSVPFFKNIHLEDMLSLGREELQGLPAFWDAWIGLLSEKKGDTEERMLKEAILYQKGKQGMLEYARLAYQMHPALYLEVLKDLEKSHDYVCQLEIGREAVEKIDKKYVIRSQIALKTAKSALQLKKQEEAEMCWLEAFKSCTKPVNYLRIINEIGDSKKYQEILKKILLSANHGKYIESGTIAELRVNVVSQVDMEALKFLNGNFDAAMDQCYKVKEALGWTGSFVKCGIALFLLFLMKDSKWGQGCMKMAVDLCGYLDFHAEQYCCGTKYEIENSENILKDIDLFQKCFNGWKMGYHLSQKQEQTYLLKLENLIDRRAHAIVSGQHRGHYGSVAALAAALGEVKESMGELGAKQLTMQKYKEKFPRHTSFHAELRAYGMLDTRKNRR